MLCQKHVQKEVEVHLPSEIALFVTKYVAYKNCGCGCHGGQESTTVGCQVVGGMSACCEQCDTCFLPCAHCLIKPVCNKLGRACVSCSRLLCHTCQSREGCPVQQCQDCETAKSRCKSCLSDACSECRNRCCNSCGKKTCKHCLIACVRCKEFFCSLCRKDMNDSRPQRKICFGCDLETLKKVQSYERAKLNKQPAMKKRKIYSSK